jgi:hypothetical protein
VRLRHPPLRGTGFPVGFCAASGVTVLAVAAGGTGNPQWTLAALAVTAAAVAATTTAPAAILTGATCWAMHSGFVLGRHGELAFTPDATIAAEVVAAATLLGLATGTAVRLRVTPRVVIPGQRGRTHRKPSVRPDTLDVGGPAAAH